MDIRFHEPGTLIPIADTFDAVASGAVEAAFSSPGIWKDKAPALQLFASVPFGPDASEYMAWTYFGGGQKLFEEIYHRHGIHSVFCGLLPPEASGWFRRKIVTADDLQGLRLRFFGLGADVMEKFGVETSNLPDREILPALEANRIDGAEFSLPSIDLKLDLSRMAKYYYFPGWHQPSTWLELMINLDSWNALSPTAKARIRSVCGDNIRYGLADAGAAQFAALKALYAKGVEIEEWPHEIIEAMQTAWKQVVTEQAAEDEDFRRVWRSLQSFREDYSIWRELSRR